MTFEIDPRGSYMMPAHFGPRPMHPNSSGWYHDVTAMTISYITDREKLAAYLPAPYEVDEEAVITVTYACSKNIDWLAGHGYNLIGVTASVIHKGEKDTLRGTYTLVVWENLTDPILAGRELQGIPKIYADIPDHSVIGGKWRTNASHFGHKIVDLSIDNLRAPTEEELKIGAEMQEGRDNPMGCRYLAAVGGFGTAINEATLFPSASTVSEVQLGEGKIDWKHLTWEQNPTQFHIANALAELPILAYLPAVVTKGSTNLVLPERFSRTLK